MPEGRLSTATLAAVVALLPLGVWCALPWVPARGQLSVLPGNGSRFPASTLELQPASPAHAPDFPPWITNTQIVDWNGDGQADVLVCDARFHRVAGYTRNADGSWNEQVLADQLPAPAHATVVDLDSDGRLDVLVSLLGNIWPDDGVVGGLVWLQNTPQGYARHTLLTDVRRVADAQAGDLDGDGDLDIAVAVFGYARGAVLWLENHGEQQFEPHTLLNGAGAIHVPLGDFDGDGDLDIATVLSQDDEEVWICENLGGGRFEPRRIFDSLNFDLGSAGLVLDDLDRDGDADLILPVGDNLEDVYSYPQAYHGCFWLENRGNWEFVSHRLVHFGGTYAAAAGDLDGDSDRDIVLVSMFNDWDTPGNASVIWLENDGNQNFTPWQIAERPTHLVTVGCGDVNSDSRDDIVTGSLQLTAPFDHHLGISLWLSRTEARP
jgi:hypothetical protein